MGKKGFTLVEVLVAIIIIMILATYSVLKYTETIYEGKNKTAKAQMEVIAGAYKRYLMEYPDAPLNGAVGYNSTNSVCVVDSVSFPCGSLIWTVLIILLLSVLLRIILHAATALLQ